MLRALAPYAIALAALTPLACALPRSPSAPSASPALDADHARAHAAPESPALSLSTAPASRGGAVVVRFLDVGQGDAAIVTTDDRHAMLVDAGTPESHEHVAHAIAALGDAALDVMVLTHPHADHMGRLADVLSAGRFAYFVESGATPAADTPPWRTYEHGIEAAARAHVIRKSVRRGDRIELGNHVEVRVLAPSEPLFSRTRSDLNANSVVLRVDHHAPARDVRFLFAGDAEDPTEKRLLAAPGELAADVLKVAHHGSRHASSETMIRAVSPRLAVISCGAGNEYGHPHAAALRHLESVGATVARTDLEGDVIATSDERGLSWTTDRVATPLELRTPGRGQNPHD